MQDMLNQIKSLPKLVSEQIPVLDDQVRQLFSHKELLSIKEIILTGCGDSYFSGMATRHFFQRICNVPTHAINSLELARYDLLDYHSQFPANPLVIATSVSGKVVRTVEAFNIAKEAGLMTLAITGDVNGPLAKATEKMVTCSMPPLPMSPGVRSYRLSLLAMVLFGIHLAEVKGTISQAEANAFRDRLRKTSDQIESTIQKSQKSAQSLAQKFADTKYFVYVGDGVNLASAHLAAAKVSEGAGLIAVPQDTEEWAHLQYFESVLPHTPTFVITSNRRGYSRLLELIEPMKRIGRTVIAVSPDDCTELNAQADFRLVVADGVEELFAAMVYPVGCELFAAYLSEAVHAQYFREDLPRYQAGDNTIYSCQLLAKEDILAHD